MEKSSTEEQGYGLFSGLVQFFLTLDFGEEGLHEYI